MPPHLGGRFNAVSRDLDHAQHLIGKHADGLSFVARLFNDHDTAISVCEGHGAEELGYFGHRHALQVFLSAIALAVTFMLWV